jgi:hypothetical protein
VLPVLLFAFVVFLLARGRLGTYYTFATVTRASASPLIGQVGNTRSGNENTQGPTTALDPFSGGFGDLITGSGGGSNSSQGNQALPIGAILGQ